MAIRARHIWRRLRLLVVLTVVAAFLLLLPARFTAPMRVLFHEAAGPVETALYQGTGRALAATGTLSEMFLREDRERALAREVARLRNENEELRDERRRLAQTIAAARDLAVLGLRVEAVRAPVSSYDASAMRRSVGIRAGTRHGVRPQMAVAGGGALVGVVTEAGPFQSRVRLITDPASAVACRVGRSRALCILQGTGGAECMVDWLDRDSFVEVGDVLVTASLEAGPAGAMLVPDGLPAATVTSVERDPMRPLFLSVRAAPRVNLERLEAVEVLVPKVNGG